jgi:D-3-phosphoglycerate dehydrogenase / 2-oxoglutarate reductase
MSITRVLWNSILMGPRAAPYVKRLEDAGLEVTLNPYGRMLTEQELVRAIPGVFATVASSEPYTERVFAAADALRIIARFGVGYDKVDVPAATRHGVVVAMTFGANHEAVADYTFSLICAVLQKVVLHHTRVQAGQWVTIPHPGLWRSTLGIVGLGRIGKSVARRARGFEMRVLAYDVQPDEAFARSHGIALHPLEALLREADIVTLHAPHLPETEQLINRDRLALMKPTAYLINTARGGLVDQDALCDALSRGLLAGAGLDVFRQEPLPESPLRQLENVVLSPHTAGNDLTSEAAMATRCVESVLAIARGKDPGSQYLLNPEVLQGASGRTL